MTPLPLEPKYRAEQPVVKVRLHSTGATSRLAALLLGLRPKKGQSSSKRRDDATKTLY